MDNTEICAKLFEAFTTGDEDAVRALCAPDMVARQNGDPPMNLDALLRFSQAVLGVVRDFRYEDAVRSSTATGFVEEHSVRGQLPDGSELNMAVCVVADVEGGRIVSLREYLDVTTAAGLVAALA